MQIKKFFVIPVGLPGMGKTTLSKFFMNWKTHPVDNFSFGNDITRTANDLHYELEANNLKFMKEEYYDHREHP